MLILFIMARNHIRNHHIYAFHHSKYFILDTKLNGNNSINYTVKNKMGYSVWYNDYQNITGMHKVGDLWIS